MYVYIYILIIVNGDYKRTYNLGYHPVVNHMPKWWYTTFSDTPTQIKPATQQRFQERGTFLAEVATSSQCFVCDLRTFFRIGEWSVKLRRNRWIQLSAHLLGGKWAG